MSTGNQTGLDRLCKREPGKHHHFISDSLHRDTLDRVACVIELLEQLDLSEGLTLSTRARLYWVHRMLVDAVKHVSDGLRVK